VHLLDCHENLLTLFWFVQDFHVIGDWHCQHYTIQPIISLSQALPTASTQRWVGGDCTAGNVVDTWYSLAYHTSQPTTGLSHTHTHTPAVHCKCCNCCVIQSLTHWHLSGYDGSLIWWYLIYSASSCSCSRSNHQVDITANVKHRKPVALWQHYTSIPIHYEKHSTITGKS